MFHNVSSMIYHQTNLVKEEQGYGTDSGRGLGIIRGKRYAPCGGSKECIVLSLLGAIPMLA
jgi:hypothetical protein